MILNAYIEDRPPSVFKLVFCKDCMYYDRIDTYKIGNCLYLEKYLLVHDNDFCSRGLKKDE